MIETEFAGARALWRESLLGRAVAATVQRLHAAISSSRFERNAQGWLEAARNRPAAERVQVCGVLAAVACATHLALRPFLSAAVVPALPASALGVIAAAGIVLAGGAKPLTRAWETSATRALWNRRPLRTAAIQHEGHEEHGNRSLN